MISLIVHVLSMLLCTKLALHVYIPFSDSHMLFNRVFTHWLHVLPCAAHQDLTAHSSQGHCLHPLTPNFQSVPRPPSRLANHRAALRVREPVSPPYMVSSVNVSDSTNERYMVCVVLSVTHVP